VLLVAKHTAGPVGHYSRPNVFRLKFGPNRHLNVTADPGTESEAIQVLAEVPAPAGF
jgi:hypothetical protein